MSGDVQPRKRKDKKKKKDDLSIEEPRGTAAALGEGDIFMHSYQEHGTGGHTCAKVIFFALLAVLVTLIGLIILENRGLSELEANSVETRYSGVLEGWLEEGHDDDHHDEHTLELNHHDDEDHDDHNDHDGDDEIELEHIEEEVFDEEVKTKAPSKAPEQSEVSSNEVSPVDADEDEIELLEPDESDELPEELPIPLPKGKPLVEVEDSTSTEKPQDTLADEEEYERQQEALRKEKEEASQGMWLKFVVGGALLVATQAVLRRATAPRENEDEVDTTREDTPLSDRRMTLITEPVPPPVTPKQQEVSRPVFQKEVVKQTPIVKSAPPPLEDEEEDVEIEEEEEEEIVIMKDDKSVAAEKNKELYSDEEEEEDEDMEEKEPPKPIVPVRELPKPTISKPVTPIKEPPKPLVKETPEKKEPPKVIEKEPTPEEEDDDVEIIEEEDIGEDLEEEEEEISDVDDAELLNRLEAKYGRLPEPERPGRQSNEDFARLICFAPDWLLLSFILTD